jgi:hypothetical protein
MMIKEQKTEVDGPSTNKSLSLFFSSRPGQKDKKANHDASISINSSMLEPPT